MLDYNERYPDINVLVGKTLVECYVVNNDEIYFHVEDGTAYKLYHVQSCCESVGIEDINGDLEDLIGSPITLSEEVSNDDPDFQESPDHYGLEQWTFYKFATVKGYVDVRWYGESNGYYSVGVDFMRCE